MRSAIRVDPQAVAAWHQRDAIEQRPVRKREPDLEKLQCTRRVDCEGKTCYGTKQVELRGNDQHAGHPANEYGR
jgi:hypothetical protein